MIFFEQEIPGDPERNKPDLVVIDEEHKIIVVDVTMPFEGSIPCSIRWNVHTVKQDT